MIYDSHLGFLNTHLPTTVSMIYRLLFFFFYFNENLLAHLIVLSQVHAADSYSPKQQQPLSISHEVFIISPLTFQSAC